MISHHLCAWWEIVTKKAALDTDLRKASQALSTDGGPLALNFLPFSEFLWFPVHVAGELQSKLYAQQ